VIEQVVRKAAETGCDAPETLLSSVDLSLDAHQRLMSGGRKRPRANTVDPNFTLEGPNVAGADLKDLINELRAYDRWRKSSGTNDGSTMALLFHGRSGTGKSHLARQIAALLDREVLFKRGSDLLSMWVGGTEQNIRDAYQEAAAKEAILVFDEADSLIFSRDRAIRSWGISHTNEFLTWMEEFEGIQIFTTNRISDLDSASLRRFNHKIEFRYLTPEGNVTFYRKLLGPLVKSRMGTPILSQLKAISRLAPGDFRIVKDKVRFKNSKKVTHEFLVEALREEARAKAIHSGEKPIGF
jgi:AAA+ superfamily predicted ATPase